IPPSILPPDTIRIDGTVLIFAVALTTAAGLLFGLTPAFSAAAMDLNGMLKQSGRGAVGSARTLFRNALAAGALALATLLLIGAGLLIQTLLHLERERIGFEPHGLITFQLAPPPAKYPLATTAPQFYQSLIDAMQALPGVRAAAVSSGIPFGVGNFTRTPMITTG